MHQIILHDFTSGGLKVAPHNAVPRGKMVPQGMTWCIMCRMDGLPVATGEGCQPPFSFRFLGVIQDLLVLPGSRKKKFVSFSDRLTTK